MEGAVYLFGPGGFRVWVLSGGVSVLRDDGLVLSAVRSGGGGNPHCVQCTAVFYGFAKKSVLIKGTKDDT